VRALAVGKDPRYERRPHRYRRSYPDLSPPPPAGRCPAVPPRGQPAAASVGVGRPPCRPGRLGVVSVPPRSPREIGVSVVTVERWSHCGTPGPPNPLTSYFPIPNFQIQLPIPIPNSQFQSLSIWRRSIRRAHDSRASPLKPAGALRLSDTPHALDGRA